MRNLVAALLSVLVFTVSAEPAPASTTPTDSSAVTTSSIKAATAKASWILIGQYVESTMYFDRNYMTINGSVRTMLVRQDWNSLQSGIHGHDFDRQITYTKIDCEGNLYVNLMVTTYKNGVELDTTGYFPNRVWELMLKPDISGGSRIERAVCK
jgi:hypothetical protein